MNDTMIIGLLSLAGTLVGSIDGILTANKMTTYRIRELEKKDEKHNSIVERTAVIERGLKSAWYEINELKDERK